MMRTARKLRWLRVLAANLLLAVAIAFVFSGVGIRTPWHQAAVAVGVAFLFAICIGPPLAWVMPRMAPAIFRAVRFPLNWIAIGTVMIGVALVGTAVAVGILTIVGFVRLAGYWTWYFGSMRVAIAVTLAIGLFVTALEVQRAQAAASSARAQLASLESRVQPHFLFNTLNSIAALVHEDPSGAEQMTTQLASLLRSSLDEPQTPLVPLAEELAIVRNYLEIERVRFGDRLRYRIDSGDAPADAQVPRLALQTLVENAVKYAISPRREGGTIAVSATAENGRLRLEVADDGPGFEASTLPDGHGLALLRARLALLFGDRASLRIARDGGARVTIDVPVRLKPDATS